MNKQKTLQFLKGQREGLRYAREQIRQLRNEIEEYRRIINREIKEIETG